MKLMFSMQLSFRLLPIIPRYRIWSLSSGKDNQLEKQWIHAAKNVLSLEGQVPHEVILCELGWTELSSKRRTADAMWWNKLRNNR